MIERLGARVIAAIVAGIVIVVLFAAVLTQCQKRQAAGKQAEVSQGQAGASIGSGAEAMNTLGNVAGNTAATDRSIAQGQGEVRGAPEADKGTVAVNAACRFKANRDKPECQPKGPTR